MTHDHAVTAKISTHDYDTLSVLGFIESRGHADEIRAALDHYFTERKNDPKALAAGIERARARQEAALAVLTDTEAPDVPEAPDTLPQEHAEPLKKPVTLRVDGRTFDLLTAFSVIDEVSLADVLRTAISHYIDFRKDDERLTAKLEEAQERQNSVLALV
ncbi:hypothetical protein [Tsukamurella hominis]|uniref:hypothetical protein n=1 Tax=Tsukamurella hominis TaxID=1970232 RepID=UPI0039EC0E1A